MKKSILYQHGTLALLVPGLFRGTERVGELLQHGDTGIGTLTGLNGELIIDRGTVYQVNATGKVRVVGEDEMVPFANVHHAAYESRGEISRLDYAALRAKLLSLIGTTNLFYAVRVHGQFRKVRTRAVAEQVEPYPTLTATAAAQSEFDAHDNVGTLSGYYSPALYAGAASPGFHLHYLSDDHQFGGHVLDATLSRGTVELQAFTDFQLHLPTEDSEFLAHDFSAGGDIVSEINKAEL